MLSQERVFTWLRACVAAGLYGVAVAFLALALPAMGREVTPVDDADVIAGANGVLIFSTLFLAISALVSWRWKAARFLCLALLALIVWVWTRIPV